MMSGVAAIRATRAAKRMPNFPPVALRSRDLTRTDSGFPDADTGE
jgi:hypothetical protein